jgi:hypothetical protein
MNNEGISIIIVSGYDNNIVLRVFILKIQKATKLKNNVFNRFILYSLKSFDIITVINFSDISMKNMKNIISFISIFINELLVKKLNVIMKTMIFIIASIVILGV